MIMQLFLTIREKFNININFNYNQKILNFIIKLNFIIFGKKL